MSARYIETSKRDGLAVLKIARPEALNALNAELLQELFEALRAADADKATHAVLLVGTPEAFSVGADVDTLAGHTSASYPHSPNAQAFRAVRETRTPLVAAVSGYCLGGGCEIALGCDLVVASETGVFGQPEIRLGIIPGAGGTQLWAERAGRGPQAMAALLGERITAYEARRIGLVERIVPVEALEDEAQKLATRLASGPPLATLATKDSLRASRRMPLESALDHELALMAGLLASDDAGEGLNAFLQKRTPKFEGR